MGADLYRSDIDELPSKRKIDAEIADMIKGTKKRTETEEERKEYIRCYEETFRAPFYFRDSYNDSSLFWKLGLSWWKDIDQYTDDEHVMHPDGIKRLEKEVRSRSELLAKNIDGLDDDTKRYFFDRYDIFLDFLKQAWEGGHTIRCSC